MQEWLDNNDILMYLAHNEEVSNCSKVYKNIKDQNLKKQSLR